MRSLPPPPQIASDYHATKPWPVAAALGSHGFRCFPLWGIRASYRPDVSLWVCECCPGGNRACRKNQPGKHPRGRGWQEIASDNPATLSLQAAKYPRANVGVRTGAVSRLLILDVDGEDGLKALERLQGELGALPQTVRSRSGREGPGFHLWWALRPDDPVLRNSASTLGAGVDVRGEGGYALIPGSLHKSGRRYAWEVAPDQVALANLPDAWLRAMTAEAKASCGAGSGHPNVRVFRKPSPPRESRGPGSRLIGDGSGRGGFNGPIYAQACAFLHRYPDAPAEPLIAALKAAVRGAPKAPGRDASRYLSDAYLHEQIERARAFIQGACR